MKFIARWVPVLLCLLSGASAQDEAKFKKKQAGILHKYAAGALKAGYPSLARPILLEILSEYDMDHAGARERLGYVRVGTAWAPKSSFVYPEGDNPSAAVAKSLEARWASTAKSVGEAHKAFATALKEAGRAEAAKYHFKRALRFLPEDSEVRTAIGHKSFAGMSGTENEEKLFERSKLMDEIVKRELRKKYKVEPVPDAEQLSFLKKAEITCKCFKSEHFTIWGEWDDAVLIEAAQYSERALAFCKEVLTGSARFSDRFVAPNFVYLKGHDPYVKVLRSNSEMFAPRSNLDFLIKNTGSTAIGRGAERSHIVGARAVQLVNDAAVRFVVQAFSALTADAMSEGIGHAVVGRFFGVNYIFTVGQDEGHTVTKRERKLLLPDMDTWKELAVEAAFNPRGTKAARLPLLKAAQFPTDARIKSWSFCDYLLRRDPKFLLELDWTKSAANEEYVAKKFESSTGVALGALEQEWKDFWTGATPVLKALRRKAETLHAVSKDAAKWLNAFNQMREEYKHKDNKNNLAVKWSASYSQRCMQHAEFLKNNRRERGPGLQHLQREGRKGATRAGSLFASMALVSMKGAPAVAMKDWIHIPGYRDALVNPYLKWVGIYTISPIAVLDVVRGIQRPQESNLRMWPEANSKTAPRKIAVKLLGPEARLKLRELEVKARTLGYPISVHGFGLGSVPADTRCAVLDQGNEKVEGFVIAGGWNRHTSAPGMGTFFPLKPLKAGTLYHVRFVRGIGVDEKQIAAWSFRTK